MSKVIDVECGQVRKEANVVQRLMDITDDYVGELIEEVVERYYSVEIELSEEYGRLLKFISRELAKGLFDHKPSPEEYEELLAKYKHPKYESMLMNVISYLVSVYIRKQERVRRID
ncbi:MAG: hypothetical protein N3E36_02120 [Sulfolobales archaeon]|nr:hypothetical protein [Sulfolobales archaeon]